jgi:hypothetical protein
MWYKIAFGFLKENILPLLLAGVMLFTHVSCYRKGQESIEQKYAANVITQLEEEAKLREELAVEREKRTIKFTEERTVERQKAAKRIEDVQDYVETNPKDSACNLSDADAELLNSIFPAEEYRDESGVPDASDESLRGAEPPSSGN